VESIVPAAGVVDLLVDIDLDDRRFSFSRSSNDSPWIEEGTDQVKRLCGPGKSRVWLKARGYGLGAEKVTYLIHQVRNNRRCKLEALLVLQTISQSTDTHPMKESC
jgi:hypothetical protein